MSYRVKQGGSIIGPKGEFYTGGSIIPHGVLTKTQINEHVASGYLEKDKAETPLPDVPVPNPPGVETKLTVPGATTKEQHSQGAIDMGKAIQVGGGGQPPAVEVATVSNGPDSVKTSVSSTPAVDPNTLSKFNLNPEDLKGKDLDELNIIALELDGNLELFTSVEEATKFLTKDFQPKIS